MRLLTWNSLSELSLTANLHDDEIPPYAILSHTWGADREEVDFSDLQQDRGKDKAGYKKLQFCGERAKSDRIDHFWVDTCCINKADLAELSEAITLMYQWYRNAKKCYVYLSDVFTRSSATDGNAQHGWDSRFGASRWFTRGWTLQELLAPIVVEFYSQEGDFLGTKVALADRIHDITKIPLAALYGTPLTQFSIAERIRWTENRQTKKKEDKAYCLLGIFDVFIPLIYGEGDNALWRLQKEIKERHREDYQFVSDSFSLRATDQPASPTASESQFLESIGPRHYFDIQDRVEGSCTWPRETRQFQSWLQTAGSSVLWITGGAGTGKTTLAGYLVEQLQNQQETWSGETNEHAYCFFFCSRDIRGRHDISSVVQNLIRQLTESRPTIVRRLKSAFDITKRTHHLPFEGIWQMLERVLSLLPYQCLYIVIDALDECESRLSSLLFRKFSQVLGRTAKNHFGILKKIKLIFTGQPHIRMSWSGAARSHDHYHIDIDDQPIGVKHDISLFIETQVAELVEDGFCSTPDGSKIKAVLEDRAENSFLWLSVVMDYIKTRLRFRMDDFENALSRVPKTLQKAYCEYLPYIPADELPIMRGYLQLLVAASRPLSFVEISTLFNMADEKSRHVSRLTVENEQVTRRTLERALGPMVRFTQQITQLVHSTATAFFLDLATQPDHSLHDSHGVSLAQAHLLCARSCMTYLLHDDIPSDLFDKHSTDWLSVSMDSPVSQRAMMDDEDMFAEIFDLGEIEFLQDQDIVDRELCTSIRQRFPVYDYAAQNWMYHMAFCQGVFDHEVDNMAIHLLCNVNVGTASWYRYYVSQTNLLLPSPSEADVMVLAAMFNLSSLMRTILNHPKIQSTPQTLSSALFWASSRGSCDAVRLLLQHGAQTTNVSTRSLPLVVATRGGFDDVCELLLQASDISPSEQDVSGDHALLLAAKAGHVQILSSILAHNLVRVNEKGVEGQTALIAASRAGTTECVEALRTDGRADVNCTDRKGRTPLLHASMTGHLTTVKALLKFFDINLHARDHNGRNALSLASQQGHLPVVKYLYRMSVDASEPDLHGRNSISWASSSLKATERMPGNEESVLEFLARKHPGILDVPDKDGWTPLTWTLDTPGYPRSAQVLLGYPSVDVNRRDATGRSILAWAAGEGVTEIVVCLLQRSDIDVNLTSSDGKTALFSAAANGMVDAVKLILKHKSINVHHLDNRGMSAADWARLNGQAEIVGILQRHS